MEGGGEVVEGGVEDLEERLLEGEEEVVEGGVDDLEHGGVEDMEQGAEVEERVTEEM